MNQLNYQKELEKILLKLPGCKGEASTGEIMQHGSQNLAARLIWTKLYSTAGQISRTIRKGRESHDYKRVEG